MKRSRWVAHALGAGLALLAATGAAPARPVAEGGPKAAIRKLLETQRADWNRGDLEGFLRGYWKSDSLTFYSGAQINRGWEATRERYIRRYQSEGNEMGTLEFDIVDISVGGPEYATVRGAFRLKRSKDAPHGIFTLILRRFGAQGWKIVHDHTSAAE